MKCIEKLIENVLFGDKNYYRVGNHAAQKKSDGSVEFIYHYTTVCIVKEGKFKTNNGGFNTSSTTRTINAYRKILSEYFLEEI